MAQVNFRIDDDTKREAEELFGRLGLSLSAAVNIFLKRSISLHGIPFAVCESPAEYDCQTATVEENAEYMTIERQKRGLLKCVGSWNDSRSTNEIVNEIESHRTRGRNVEL